MIKSGNQLIAFYIYNFSSSFSQYALILFLSKITLQIDNFQEMTNFVIQTCKRGIPLVFLLAQTLMIIVLEQIDITSPVYLLLAAFATTAYLWTAYSNPGFVIYEIKELSPPPISISQPIIPLHHISPKDYDRLVSDQLPIPQRGQINELGLESFILGSEQNNQCSPSSLQEVQKIRKNAEYQTEVPLQQSQRVEQTRNNSNKHCPSLSIVKEQTKMEENGQLSDHIKESIVFQYKADNIEIEQKVEPTIIPQRLRNLTRWCKACKSFQPLRTRHCLQCHRCVANFDHHCPWMNTCIGEKNKLKLFLFVILEDIQLWYLTFKIERVISINPHQNSLILLWLIVIFLTIVITIMLLFQIFLILKNITTWQHIRWSKIEYLKIFDQAKLRSLFDRGVKENILMAFRAAWAKENISWINFISPQAHNHQIKQDGQTDRRLTK